MAFEIRNLTALGAQSVNRITPQLFSYGTSDAMATVMRDGYFDNGFAANTGARALFRQGDTVLVRTADAVAQLRVRSNVAGVIKTAPIAGSPPPAGLRAVLIGDSITGQNMYRVTATSITRNGGIATVTASAHNLFPGAPLFVGGCNEAEFNGHKTVIARISASEFTYAIDTNAPAAASGANISILNQTRFQDRAWFEMANASLGHPFHQVACAGISGAGIDVIAGRFDDDVLSLAPDLVVIQGAINSIIGTSPGNESASLASIKAFFVQMIEKTLAFGAIPLVLTAGPLSAAAAGYSAARGQMVLRLNHWLHELAAYAYPRMLLHDSWQVLVGPTSATGDYAASLSTDGIHRTALGAQREAASLKTLLTPLAVNPVKRVGSVLDTWDNDNSNPQVYPNPLNTGTGGTKTTAGAGGGTNTGNVPDGVTVLWTRGGAGTVVNSIVSRADGIGSDHQLVVVAGNANDAVQVDLTTTIQARFSAGDTVVAEVHLVMTGITALTSISYWIVWTLDGVVYTSPAAISGSAVGALGDDIDMVLRTPPFVIPPGSLTTFEPRFIATFSGAGGATIKLGRQSVTKLQTVPA